MRRLSQRWLSSWKLGVILIFLGFFTISALSAQPENGPPGDYGDAPENLPSRYLSINPEPIAIFPSLYFAAFDPLYIIHQNADQHVRLGQAVTKELNALVVDQDEDDGWRRGSLIACQEPQLELSLSVPSGAENLPIYLNLLFDWNHDGLWSGASSCKKSSGGQFSPEWAIRNLRLDQSPYRVGPGFEGRVTLPSILVGPDAGELWMRVTVTTAPVNEDIFTPVERSGVGWNGQGSFQFGETEDYFSCVLADRDSILLGCPTSIISDAIPENRPPVARNDNSQTSQNSGVQVPILENDYDPDGDKLLLLDTTQPANGKAFINPNQTISYVPNNSFVGTNTFIYTVCDTNGFCSKAVVSITVQ